MAFAGHVQAVALGLLASARNDDSGLAGTNGPMREHGGPWLRVLRRYLL